MSLRRYSAATCALVLAVALTACQGGDGAGSDPNDPDQVEVITWWASGSDQSALYSLVSVFGQQHPGLDFIDASVRDATGEAARHSIAVRLGAGNPPDAFQAVAGAGLAEYVENGQVQELSGFFADNELTDVFRADLLETLRVDGRLYSVPSDIHRANVLWMNSSVLDRAGLDPSVAPAGIDAWIGDLERVRSSGVAYPLALGDGQTRLQLFENVLLARLGPEQYRALFLVGNGWTTGAVEDAVKDYQRLLGFADPTQSARTRDEVVDAVVYGDAAYVVMADYAVRAFDGVGYELGRQFQAVPMPGTAGSFSLVADCFTLPTGAAHQDASRAWLLTVASAEGQRALNLAKGSISARSDVDPADYPPYQQTALASLDTDSLVPSLAHGIAASPTWTAAISAAVEQFGRDHRVAALMSALQTAASAALDSGSN
jgi:glucose/mannose transport system substrate-binding protein